MSVIGRTYFRRIAIICPSCGQEYGGLPRICGRCKTKPDEWWVRVLMPPEEVLELFNTPLLHTAAEREAEARDSAERELARKRGIADRYVQVMNGANGMWALIDKEDGKIIDHSEEMFEDVPEYQG